MFHIRHIYLFNSSSVSASEITYNPIKKIFDSKIYFEEGSADGSTTSDALVSIADNGIGYIANIAYWNVNYKDLVDGNAYHTFKFRKTTDYGATWSETSFDPDVPYYYINDSVFEKSFIEIPTIVCIGTMSCIRDLNIISSRFNRFK